MKKYTLEMIIEDDGKLRIESRCEGFYGLEILGLLAWKKEDIVRQLYKEIQPDIIQRGLVKED